jgi:hypothetical protein
MFELYTAIRRGRSTMPGTITPAAATGPEAVIKEEPSAPAASIAAAPCGVGTEPDVTTAPEAESAISALIVVPPTSTARTCVTSQG